MVFQLSAMTKKLTEDLCGGCWKVKKFLIYNAMVVDEMVGDTKDEMDNA